MGIKEKKGAVLAIKIFATIVACVLSYIPDVTVFFIAAMSGKMDTVFGIISVCLCMLILPGILISLIWVKPGKRRCALLIWFAFSLVSVAYPVYTDLYRNYDESITVDTAPNILTHEYLPFEENSKIVKYRSESLEFKDNLPRIDGAAALFPVYSAFVNATYPQDTVLGTYQNESPFMYRNTPDGYKTLAQKGSDIFIGVYPSQEQIDYAKIKGTELEYTKIGTEAFVFITHKDNPVESLTTQEIKDIYSGKITNWKEVGGEDIEIVAYQRNEGSGSQSMLERFMEGTPIAEPPKEQVNDLMSGIIDRVSKYKSKSNSLGFSFRYYVEGIIKNPDIKMLSVDGVPPTAENVRNGSYKILTPIYAVTYKDNPNSNVKKLLEWICGEEGQRIINETGYVGIK